MGNVFESNNLGKSFGACKALDKLSMHIPEGSIYGFVGKNGAGKTTLIRVLCGLQFPTSGSFSLFGIGGTGERQLSARRRIGAIIEAPALYESMSARENMMQHYRVLGLPSFSDIPDLLRLVGLEDTGKKTAGHFSLGMRQKLGIAMALAGDPDFLVLDEPTNGLDPQGIVELRELLKQLNREKHITALISSHMLGELSKLATHYGFIDHGNMIREMTAEELEQEVDKYVRVKVSDIGALDRALTKLQFRTKGFWLCTLFMLAVTVVFLLIQKAATSYSVELDRVVFLPMALYGVADAALVSLFVGEDHHDGGIRNKIIAGVDRGNIYKSVWITSIIGSCALYLLTTGTSLILGLLLFPMNVSALVICEYFILGVFTCLAYGSIFAAISVLAGNRTRATVICMLLSFCMLFLCLHTNQILVQALEPSTIVDGGYISDAKFLVYSLLHDLNPSGQAAQLSSMHCLSVPRFVVVDLIWAVSSLCLSRLKFTRMDIL